MIDAVSELELLNCGAESPATDTLPIQHRRRKKSAALPPPTFEAQRLEYVALVNAAGLPDAWLLMWPDIAAIEAAPEAAEQTIRKLLEGVQKMRRAA